MAVQINILKSVEELSEMMSETPAGVDRSLAAKGEALLGIYFDENYTLDRFPDLNERKIEILRKVVEDVSMGVMTLRSFNIGLTTRNNKIEPYIVAHGKLPQGNVVYSVNWRNIVAFKNWRKGGGDPVSQDDINAAIYFLAVAISKLLK